MHPYSELKHEYESWVANCVPRPECVAAIDHVARRLTVPTALTRLGRVEAATGIKIVVQACIGERECGFDFSKNWGQGDPLTRPSTHVPKGRPPLGAAPNDRFPVSWEYAAIDAFTVCDHLNVLSVPEWTLPYACWKWEGYNGLGYRAHGRRTPYVVGGSNLQQPGKYVADGVWDASHMDTQLGCLPVALRMIELVPSLAFGQALAMVAAPSIVPLTTAPAAIGGGLTGTRWVQASLNLILHLDPPLRTDGSYGRITKAAVRQAQLLLGLPITGYVDNALCDAIDAKLASMRPVSA